MKICIRSATKKLGYILAVVVICLAMLVAISRVLTPILNGHRADIEQWASKVIDAPVTIEKVRISWFQYQPVISLKRVTVLDKKSNHPALQVKNVHMMFSIPRSLWERTFVLSGIAVSGTEVTLHEGKDSEVSLEGFPSLGGYSSQPYQDESKVSDVLKWIASEPRLILRDIDIRYTNQKNVVRNITLYDLHLNNDDEVHTISGKAILHQDVPTEIDVAIDWEGNPADYKHIQAKGYLYASGLGLKQWLQGYKFQGWHVDAGLSVAKVWFSWANNQLTSVQTVLTAYDLIVFNDADKTKHHIQRLSGDFGWKQVNGMQIIAADDVLIDLPDHLWPATSFYVELLPNSTGKLVPKMINLGYMDLKDIQYPLFSVTGLVTDDWKKKIKALQLQGNLDSVNIKFNGVDLTPISLTASVSRVTFVPTDSYPGIKNFTGSIDWSKDNGKLTLQSLQTEIRLNEVFLQPLLFDHIAGNIEWVKNPSNNWQFTINGLQLQNDDVTLSANGLITVMPNQDVATNVHANFNMQQAKNITRYLPLKLFDKDLVGWLQQAFLSGTVTEGVAILRGPLKDYPFDKGNGEFRIAGKVNNINLHYAPNWPMLNNLTGQLTFSGRGMVADIERGDIMQIPLSKVHAVIPYLGDDKPQELIVQSDPINTDFSQGLAFLHASPLEKTIGKMFATTKVHGPLQLTLGLNVPLSHPDDTKVKGLIALKDAEFNMVPWGLVLKHLQGQLEFTESTIVANHIQGKLFSQPLDLSLQTLPATKLTPSVIRATLTNKISINDLETWVKYPLKEMVQGEANVMGTIDFSSTSPINAHLTSDLVGITVSSPDAQYNKAANVSRAFTADIIVQDKQPLRLKMNYGDLLEAALLLERNVDTFDLTAANIGLGKVDLKWPTEPGLYLTGQIAELDWEKIKSYLSQSNSKKSFSNLTLREIDLFIEKLTLPGQTLVDTRIELTPEEDEWELVISNSDMAGRITLPDEMTPKSTIYAQFQQLHLSGASTATKTMFEVKSIPAINFTANNVTYNSLPLGQVSFKTTPNSSGLTINSLTIDSPHLSMKTSGNWVQSGTRNTTNLQGKASSKHVSGFLNSLGFDVHNLITSRGTVNFKLNWSDAPYSPSLNKLSGTASMDLGKGRIIEVSQTSGAKMDLGRMLSIFSLQTIPRRLSFDFSDVMQKGYSFDTFKGDFNFTNGSAYTNNTQFDGPVARVGINGRIGLAEKDYDFTLSVTPYVTSSLPVTATLLTGQPLVGIAAFAVNQVFGSQVSKVATYYYAVRGPWNNPTWDSIKSPR